MRFAALMISSLFAGLCSLAPLYAADTQTEGDNDEDRVLEEIIVVGSRVSRTNLDSPSPVIIIDASDLTDRGITTLGEFARYLPQNAAIESPGTLTNGTAGINLRGIGLDGTLTLLNGRRVAAYGSSGDLDPFVDINAIPVAAIERIEILPDGASAIYGSDAVAGVVNIVTRTTIEGATVDGGFLTTAEGDGDEWDLNLTGGWNNETTSVTGTLSWFDSDLIWSRDRDWADTVDLRDRGGYDFSSSASSPPSVYLLESKRFLADPACPENSPTAHLQVYKPGIEEYCVFNFRHFVSLQHPSDRLGMTAFMRHDFSVTTSFFAELLANRSETESTVAPTVLWDFFVPASHPDNPWGEDLLLEGGRALDVGNRSFRSESTTWRLVAGLEGAWGSWDWEAAITGGEAEADHTRFNDVLTEPFQAALLGEGGSNGDQYYNPFGLFPQNPQEVIDGFAISGTHFIETTEEQTVDFQVSGHFGSLPGGAIGAAFGGQYRHNSIDQSADEEELTGVIAGTEGFEPISDDEDIYSAFAELVVPVLPTLEAQLAVRYDDYSNTGSTTNPKIGLGWKPVETLLLRATWGTSFREPTFRELTDPLVRYDDAVFKDPWRCPATGDSTDCRFNLITSEFSGNPDLEPDEGETWLIGFTWEPTQTPGLTVSMAYWLIEHTNRITTSESRFLFETLPPDDNPFVIRAPQTAEDLALGIPGVIIGKRNTYINADTVTTDGVDFSLEYQWDTASAGSYSSGVIYTWLNEYTNGFNFGGAGYEEDIAGRAGAGSTWPQHRGNAHLDWEQGSHGATAEVHYTGHYHSPFNWVVDDEETDRPFNVDDYWQLDLHYRYVFESLRQGMLQLGCRNCFDADPPTYNYPIPGEYFHEGRGALLYLRWTQPFK
jgi:outer membrane receptor protein involved in Fe transport